jgi:hypothetical protein
VCPVLATRLRPTRYSNFAPPFDYTAALAEVCFDAVHRCAELAHIRMNEVLVSFTPSRNRSPYGLQARVTPLRFRDGSLTRREGRTEYQVQRFVVDDREMLYLLTFCLPRFLDQSFEQKLITVFHELYHISPAFNGDLRRHPGRYEFHSDSKSAYDSHMARLVHGYLKNHPDSFVLEFLRKSSHQLLNRYGGIVGVTVPRPKLLPVRRAALTSAARRIEKSLELRQGF